MEKCSAPKLNTQSFLKNSVFLLFLLSFISFSFHGCKSAKGLSKEHTVPPPPDYSQDANWASLPWIEDNADLVPDPTMETDQSSAAADVFFIHPTTYIGGQSEWNAFLNDETINNRTDDMPIKYQASVFNGTCRVFAPRYRQVHLKSFYVENFEDELVVKAFDLAYSDVLASFKYYLEHHNEGRPIIIASHSQGTVHAKRLLQDLFDDDKRMQNKLVAAYLVGMPVRESDFKNLKPCVQAKDCTCYVSWATFAKGAKIKDFYKGAVTTNPLNWTIDGTYAPKSENLGALLRKFDSTKPELVDAHSKDGILWVSKPDIFGKALIWTKNYHIADYNLFYMNIRQNVATRLDIYYKRTAG